MSRTFHLTIFILLLSVFSAVSCSSDKGEVICTPGEYRCGGNESNLVQYCESTGFRWETLTNCEDTERVCEDGKCISSSTEDGDYEEDIAEISEESDSDTVESEEETNEQEIEE